MTKTIETKTTAMQKVDKKRLITSIALDRCYQLDL